MWNVGKSACWKKNTINIKLKHSWHPERSPIWSDISLHSRLGLGIVWNVWIVKFQFLTLRNINMVFYTTKKPYFWNVECLNKHPFHNCAWINCGRNQELSQQTEQTLSRYLYRLLILYADDTFLMVPKRFWGSIPSTDVIWLDFWKKGGSPVCHGLKCVHIKRERVLVWNVEKENQKKTRFTISNSKTTPSESTRA